MYGPKWPFYSFLSICGPGEVNVKMLGHVVYLGWSSLYKGDFA